MKHISFDTGQVAHLDIVRYDVSCPWTSVAAQSSPLHLRHRRGVALLLHGITVFAEKWAPQLVAALNGIGLDVAIPTYGDRCASLPVLASALVDAVEPEVDRDTRVVVIGHSMGGMIAQEAALEIARRQWLLAAVVLAGTGAPYARCLMDNASLTRAAWGVWPDFCMCIRNHLNKIVHALLHDKDGSVDKIIAVIDQMFSETALDLDTTPAPLRQIMTGLRTSPCLRLRGIQSTYNQKCKGTRHEALGLDKFQRDVLHAKAVLDWLTNENSMRLDDMETKCILQNMNSLAPAIVLLNGTRDALFPMPHQDLLATFAPSQSTVYRLTTDSVGSGHALRALLDEDAGVCSLCAVLDGVLRNPQVYRRS